MNSNNLCPLTCRITLDYLRKEFSTGLFINPENWNAQKQKAFPFNTDNTQINTQLSLIKQEINQAFLFLKVQGRDFNVEDIYRQYKGETIKDDKSIRIFAEKKMEESIFGMYLNCSHRQINHLSLILSLTEI
ncbi:Arm DNA-binding domain-containing protein [Chryseobacterium suipulveris]|uniref:Arm DNA-binding domain-containing protein n=2 Tax=Chryseobacterium suipulveris TaxID=2929800 RepID=A0ABY4BTM1_9FLAO|nr:Arm DNA-binding domain-containing protein [Chryseobacterium suipulveris]